MDKQAERSDIPSSYNEITAALYGDALTDDAFRQAVAKARKDCERVRKTLTDRLIFRWNRETAYRLRITSGGRTAVAVDSIGDRYMPEPATVVAYDSLEWMLEADGQVITGKTVNRRGRPW